MAALRSSARFAAPSIPAVVFALLAALVPILLQKPLLNSDGDLARHLRHGRYMLDTASSFAPIRFPSPGRGRRSSDSSMEASCSTPSPNDWAACPRWPFWLVC